MAYIDESQARGLAKRTIRELHQRLCSREEEKKQDRFLYAGHKRSKRELIKLCSADSRYVFLEDRYREKSRWEVVWGAWGICSYDLEPESLNDYARIAFNLVYSHKLNSEQGHFNLILSKHALIRILMRCEESLRSADDVLCFLKPLTRELVWAGLSKQDGNTGNIIKYRNYYLPFILENNNTTFVFKTLLLEGFSMDEYDIVDRSYFRKSIFEYPEIRGKSNGAVFDNPGDMRDLVKSKYG